MLLQVITQEGERAENNEAATLKPYLVYWAWHVFMGRQRGGNRHLDYDNIGSINIINVTSNFVHSTQTRMSWNVGTLQHLGGQWSETNQLTSISNALAAIL